MIVFYNDGLIDLAAVKTVGVSIKKENAFGRFGTGIKYGLGTALRNGAKVVLIRGGKVHKIGQRAKMIREQPFAIVTLDGKELGFTTDLGKDWTARMVLREFACNARDEGGSFEHYETAVDPASLIIAYGSEGTIIAIEWPELDAAYKDRGNLFLEGEEIARTPTLRLVEGARANVFYQGVSVFTLDRQARYSYDLLTEQKLTEDRTLANGYGIGAALSDYWLTSTDSARLIEILDTDNNNFYENTLPYDDSWVTPSKEFISACIAVREDRNMRLQEKARAVLMKHIRSNADSETYSRRSQMRDDAINYAIGVCADLGMKFDEKAEFVTVDELPGDAKSIIESGRIFMLKSLNREKMPVIVEQLIRRWIDLKFSYATADDIIALLVPLLMKTHKRLEHDMRLIAEEEAATSTEEVTAAADEIEVQF